jgi:formyltetrahydrofolate hydrolase
MRGKNLCKCHNVPPHSITVSGKKRKSTKSTITILKKNKVRRVVLLDFMKCYNNKVIKTVCSDMSTDKWMKETKKKVQKQAYKYIIN